MKYKSQPGCFAPRKNRFPQKIATGNAPWSQRAQELLASATGSVDSVQKERNVDVRLETFTRDQMIFRVGWWMKDNDDYYKLRQLVNRAIIKELKKAGVVLPYRKGRPDVDTDSIRKEVPKISRILKPKSIRLVIDTK